jgi:hypothetical protein
MTARPHRVGGSGERAFIALTLSLAFQNRYTLHILFVYGHFPPYADLT